MSRPEISLTDNTKDVLVTLSEGNPGALRVLMQLLAHDGGLFDLLHLDDMNIRGTQVWVAFKDFAKEDLAALRWALPHARTVVFGAANVYPAAIVELERAEDVLGAQRGTCEHNRDNF